MCVASSSSCVLQHRPVVKAFTLALAPFSQHVPLRQHGAGATLAPAAPSQLLHFERWLTCGLLLHTGTCISSLQFYAL